MRELDGAADERADVELLAQIGRIVVAQRLGEVLGQQGMITARGSAFGWPRSVLDRLRLAEEIARSGEGCIDECLRQAVATDLEEADLFARLCDSPRNSLPTLAAACNERLEIDAR
jgi:hypothetical protein